MKQNGYYMLKKHLQLSYINTEAYTYNLFSFCIYKAAKYSNTAATFLKIKIFF